MSFTHLDAAGNARMVDVTEKTPTIRSATASAHVACAPAVVSALRDQSVPKGDVLAVARIAGIAGAKHTATLLPLAHVIGVHGAAVIWRSLTAGSTSSRPFARPTAREWRWRRSRPPRSPRSASWTW